jgi:hypothetical protein
LGEALYDIPMKIIHAFCFCLLIAQASAKFARPVSVPVERLEKKADAYLTAHPEDAQAWYTLGRIHYLAFIMKSDQLNAFEGNEGDAPQLHHFQRSPDSDSKPVEPKPETAARHVSEALRCYNKAISLKVGDGLSLLGKASLLDQYMEPDRQKFLEAVKTKPAPVSKEEIIALYLRAYDAGLAKDQTRKYMPMLGLGELVTHEAGNAYLKLSPTGARAKEITQHLAKLKSLPRGPITPVIAAPAQSIQQLFQSDQASFDLTGLGWPQNYPWPGERAAFLVWDPAQTGRISNGRQLFGFFTWGIFWRDGYQALSMLDDNDDGLLSDKELDGISLWTDRNHNGVSDPGEVETTLDKRVKSIRVQSYFKEGIHPMCPGGIEFHDQAPWTSWDWMAEPVTIVEND